MTESDTVRKKPTTTGSTSKSVASMSKPVNQILEQIFTIKTDKDQNIKPANINKTQQNAIINCQSSPILDSVLIENIVADASKTDPELNVLAKVVVSASKCKNDEARKNLLLFCVRLASLLWIRKHHGSHDLYHDIFESYESLNSSRLNFLKNSVDSIYRRRLENTLHESKSISQHKVSGAETELIQLKRKSIERQRNNILLIGCLWLMAQSKTELSETVVFLSRILEEHRSSTQSNRNIALYIAEQVTRHDDLLADTLYFFEQKSSKHAAQTKSLQSELAAREQEVSTLNKKLIEQQQLHRVQLQHITSLETEMKHLKHTLDEQQLDERAKRTHLRDDVGQVKAKAFNLLSEEVLEPLKLSLSALQREKPKAKVAAHHIELAVESIERDIKWFTE